MTAHRRVFAVALIVLGLVDAGAAQNPVLAPPSGRRPDLPIIMIPDGKASIAGRAVEAGSSSGVSGAEVTLADLRLKAYRIVTTDTDGNFAIGELPAGSFELTITKEGWLPGSVGRTRPSGSTRLITIAAEDRRTGVVVPMWRPATITGSVRDENNEPLAGARIQIFSHVYLTGIPALGRGSATVTDERGVYRAVGLAPGDYVVGIDMPGREGMVAKSASIGYLPLFFPDATDAAQALVVTLGSGDERPGVDFTTRTVPVFPISGVVTAAGMDPSNTTITLMPASVTDAVATLPLMQLPPNKDGTFRFERVAPGDYILRVVANIGETPSTPSLFRAAAWNESRISISDKPVADLKVTLQRGVNVSGSIQFKGSAAVPKLEYAVGVVLTQAKVAWRMPLAMAFIDPRGQFSMASVVPGHYVLEMSGTSALAGWSLASAMVNGVDITDEPIDITNDISDVVITFTDQPTRVSGRVTVAGVSRADAMVMAFPVDEGQRFGRGGSPRRIRNVRTSPDGMYSMVNLPPGAYFIAAVMSDEAIDDWLYPEYVQKLSAVATRVDVRAGERVTRDLVTTHIR